MSFDMLRNEALPFSLLCGALFCFGVYWAVWSGRETVSLTGAWVKAGATGLLVVLLLNPVMLDPQSLADPFGPIMALGLLFGAIGDFALARRGERAFLAGMAAFAIGHLIYAGALWHRTGEINAHFATENVGTAVEGLSIAQGVALIALAVLLLSTEAWLAPKTGALRWPVRGYVLVIGLMAAVVITLVDIHGAGLLRVGAALFVLSDLLLALRLFVVPSPRAKRVLSLMLWPAYWGGQMLLMLGAMGYGALLKG